MSTYGPTYAAGNRTSTADVAASTPELWAKSVLREHKVRGFWSRFTGPEGSGKPIIQKTELLNKPGDKINITVTNPLTGAGVSGNDIPDGGAGGARLEGNEEDLTTSAIKTEPTLYRHAVRWNRRADKRNIVDLRAEAKMRLSEWGATKMDTVRFDLFTRSDDLGDTPPVSGETYTPNVYIPGAGVSDADDIALQTTGDAALTVRDCQLIKLALVNQKAKPMMLADGQPVYFMVTSPNAAFNLKRDDEYQEYVKLARERAVDNPLFSGALAMIDGLVIFDHPNVPVAGSGHATPIDIATGIAFGAEFAVEALDENPHSETETFDYGLEIGISYEFAFQPRRALELSSILVAASDVQVAT